MKTVAKIGMLGILVYGGYYAMQHIDPLTTNLQSKSEELHIEDWPPLGEIAHTHNGVDIYSNGDVVYESHGKHFASDGFYYGRKWQCVEFVKRYYYDALGHTMPDPWGHAKQYFDPAIPHGEINPARNLTQFRNNHTVPPKANDLLVWGGKYGHVAIVAEVYDNHILIAQQNIKHRPIVKMPLTRTDDGHYILGATSDSNKPLGWLRIP